MRVYAGQKFKGRKGFYFDGLAPGKFVISINHHQGSHPDAFAVQTVGVAILRGYNDTKMIFAATLVCYWLVGMPLGCLLGRTDCIVPRLGAVGFWTAFIVGISLAAALYLARIRVLEKRFAADTCNH